MADSNKAKRYDDATKKKVVDFVLKHNEESGRGGKSAAAAKFGISPISISNWLEAAGMPPKRRGAKSKAKAARKGAGSGRGRGRRAAAAPAVADGDIGAKLQRLNALHQQIADLQAEFEAIKSSL